MTNVVNERDERWIGTTCLKNVRQERANFFQGMMTEMRNPTTDHF